MNNIPVDAEAVKIDKLVHGGQGIGELPDGRKVFVWNALPGETVRVRVGRHKKSYAEGIATEVLTASPDRIEPRDAAFLATSPWQIMSVDCENTWKLAIVRETFEREHVAIPDVIPVTTLEPLKYRNKMEYSFWGDAEHGLCLALFNRGTHQKIMVEGSAISMPSVDAAALAVRDQLRRLEVRAGDLKSVIVRASQDGTATASLYVKKEQDLDLTPLIGAAIKGIRIWYSDPRSPASVQTNLLAEYGDTTLTDTILGTAYDYTADSFFQVNVPVYESVLNIIKKATSGMPALVDMYSGVGTIGLSCDAQDVTLVELDADNVAAAEKNLAASGRNGRVIHASTEKALEFVTETPIIVDPPRAGLHPKLIDKIMEALPQKIIYLSCNPSTQARDVARLIPAYAIEDFRVFNFFPRTPHIETLVILSRKP